MTKQEFLTMSLPSGLNCNRIFYDTEELSKESGIHIIDGFDYEIYSDGGVFDLKPILYPLSDYEKLGLDITDEIAIQDVIDKCNIIENVRFGLVKYLIDQNFDIAGLIEKGEAIDVNTLSENPYK